MYGMSDMPKTGRPKVELTLTDAERDTLICAFVFLQLGLSLLWAVAPFHRPCT